MKCSNSCRWRDISLLAVNHGKKYPPSPPWFCRLPKDCQVGLIQEKIPSNNRRAPKLVNTVLLLCLGQEEYNCSNCSQTESCRLLNCFLLSAVCSILTWPSTALITLGFFVCCFFFWPWFPKGRLLFRTHYSNGAYFSNEK